MTDFGTRGWYVASLKGVIAQRCPQAQLIDVTHDVPPQDILSGAFTLAAAAPWFPSGTVFACVVDPGVGTDRPLIAGRADRRFFVGPDNGLLSLVFQRAARLSLVRLTQRRYWLSEVSRTFHGRDIIAPVSAHLARGCPVQRLGMPVRRYQRLALPTVRRTATTLYGRLLLSDAFGNLVTNLPSDLLVKPSGWQVRFRRTPVRVVSSYAEGRSGELVALAGSTGYVELALPNASADSVLRARRGEPVELRRQ